MARDEVGDIIEAIIGGGVGGYKSAIEPRKEIYKEILKRQMFPEESRLKTAQAESQEALAGFYKNIKPIGSSKTNTNAEDLSSFIPSGEDPEDYKFKPIIRSVKGIPQRTLIPEKKEKVPIKQLTEIKDIDVNMYELEKNLKTLEQSPEIKEFIGPGIVQRPGAIADILSQLGYAPKEFSTFKADVDKSFQKYRKWITGVQAGYPELQWLVVDFPKTTDKADIFVSKTISGLETMKKNKEMFLDYLSANDYATSKIRNIGKLILPSANQNITREQAIAELKRRGKL